MGTDEGLLQLQLRSPSILWLETAPFLALGLVGARLFLPPRRTWWHSSRAIQDIKWPAVLLGAAY